MGSRPYLKVKSNTESNRKQRKERWIKAKNLMRAYPECAYGGEFYCEHEYDPTRGWSWVDFRFFHTKLKMYFAVAMTTLEYEALEMLDVQVDEELDLIHPYPDTPMYVRSQYMEAGQYLFEVSEDFSATYNVREPLKKQRMLELTREAQMMRPSIDVRDYGSVAVGLMVSLNVPVIDESVIKDFIKFYRSIGEPWSNGFQWRGEEVSVVPAKLEERYAKLRSNSEAASVG